VSRLGDFVVVANRLPVHRVHRDGATTWRTSPGGLVTALSPVLRQQRGIWVGWAGIPGDPPARFCHENIEHQPVGLDRSEIRDFYEGMCNRTLWPLYHDAVRHPRFRRRWWTPYVDVNRRFAQVVTDVAAEGATVWIHDFHLQLVPAMLREQRPDLRIGFFLHIPFPPQELFAQLPWRNAILEGLLGADVVGFQTTHAARNFRQLCRRFGQGRIAGQTLIRGGRRIRAQAYPISIDVDFYESLAARDGVIGRARDFRQRLGDRRIMLGVDRLDYTKGIDRRLNALVDLLRAGRIRPAEWVFVQVGVPSRERVAEYRRLRSRVERLIGKINGEFSEIGKPVVEYISRSLPATELVALYLAADVLTVTPLRDGMNLVAKEYVATRRDDTGALVLSEFSGASNELRSAVLINPHDIDGIASGFQRATEMDRSEQRRRMRSMRQALRRNTVFDWSRAFLSALHE